jgi:mono/diheme cytochrome c family protein
VSMKFFPITAIRLILLIALSSLVFACVTEENDDTSSPAILAQPTANFIVDTGVTIRLGVLAEGSSLTYTWVKNGTDTVGTLDTLVLTHIDLSDSGTYVCVIRNKKGTVTSSPSLVRVNFPAPVILGQPVSSQIAAAGGTVRIGVFALGVGTLTYTWIHESTDTVGTEDTLVLANVDTTDIGSYVCVVRNSGGMVTSNPADLNILVLHPIIVGQPASVSVRPGGMAMFTVVATGSNITYQWVRGSADTLVGKTSSTLTITNVPETPDYATYKCVMRNAYGTTVSASATMHVTVPRSVLISTGAVIFENCTGCHGMEGRGYAGASPPLANSDFFMANRRKTIEIVLGGYDGPLLVNGMVYQGSMPTWAESFTNAEVAGVLTYIRAVLNDSAITSCSSSAFDEEGFAICTKAKRTPAAIAADSVSIREVRLVRDSMGLPPPQL